MSKIPLKILVDKERKKVIFAEAENDFVDTLISFLTLPMGTIVSLLRDEKLDSQPVSFGSLSTLHEGLAKLDPKYFWTEEYCKNMLLKPRNSSESECRKLKVNVDYKEPSKYFICENWKCSRGYRCLFSPRNIGRCICGKPMNRELCHEESNVNMGRDNCGVFVTKTTFIISDDLRIMNNVPSSSFELLKGAGIKEMKVLEEKTFSFGFKEFLCLLKRTLSSKTPLTDFIFEKKAPVLKSEQMNSCPTHLKTTSSSSKKINLKLVVQKSNKKVLFGQAEEDFIDFVFGLLTIPLGSVVSLLGGYTSLGCIDNLYKSVTDLTVGRHIKSNDLKNRLIYPQLAQLHLSNNQIFSLHEETVTSGLYCHIDSAKYTDIKGYLCFSSLPLYTKNGQYSYSPMNLKDPKFDGGFVKGPNFFMVTDDLVVTKSSSITAVNCLIHMKISVCDVEEQVVSIGVDEALSILKASLHTDSALTNGLCLFLKKPKQEP